MKNSSYDNKSSQYEQWDDNYNEEMPRAAHWSIAWSDLMMTMFILFLSMFVYQSANQQFLGKKTPEIVGGDTTDALEVIEDFDPFNKPAKLPFITAGNLPKIENKPKVEDPQPEPVAQNSQTSALSDLQTPDIPDFDYKNSGGPSSIKPQAPAVLPVKIAPSMAEFDFPQIKPDVTVEKVIQTRKVAIVTPIPPVTKDGLLPQTDIIQPQPLNFNKNKRSQTKPQTATSSTTMPIQEIFTQSKNMVENNSLEKFATVDLVQDKTVRIILTGDLLFSTGKSDLSFSAKQHIRDITKTISSTPYMINIVGHTDNIPMSSGKFPSNWELSVARASSVARFLISDIGMDPNQFVVSGYSSYRPVKPNNSSKNRAANRRVEIIISKRLPPPIKDINKL